MQILIPCLILGGMGLFFGFIISFASKKLHVEVDTRIEDITSFLPNANCGGCGYPGCSGFAQGIVEGNVKNLSQCRPGKTDKNFNPILEYLQKQNESSEKKINVKI